MLRGRRQPDLGLRRGIARSGYPRQRGLHERCGRGHFRRQPSVNETITDADGNTTDYSQTFEGPCSQVNIFTEDGNSTVDGSALDSSTAFSVLAGDGDNMIYAGPGWNNVVAGDGDNYVVAGNGGEGIGANYITLGNGNNTVAAGSGDADCDITTGNGDNVFYIDTGNGCCPSITAGSGDNELVLTDVTVGEEPTVTTYSTATISTTYYSFDNGVNISYNLSSVNVDYALVENGVSNSLTLDNGGTVYGLDGVPGGTNVTLDNGTTLYVGDQSTALGAVTLNDASSLYLTSSLDTGSQQVAFGPLTLNDGSSVGLDAQSVTSGPVTLNDGTIDNGSLTAASYTACNGSIGANLPGGPLTVEGGTVALSGTESGPIDVTAGSELDVSGTLGGDVTDDGVLGLIASNQTYSGAISGCWHFQRLRQRYALSCREQWRLRGQHGDLRWRDAGRRNDRRAARLPGRERCGRRRNAGRRSRWGRRVADIRRPKCAG